MPTRLLTNTALTGAALRRPTGTYTLGLRHAEQERGLHAATPRGWCWPPATTTGCRSSSSRCATGSAGTRTAASTWPATTASTPPGRSIFLQNAGTHTHSFTAPDLGMGAVPQLVIIRELPGREHYPIEKTHRVPGVRRADRTLAERDRRTPHRRPARRVRPATARPGRRRRAAARLGDPPEGRVLADAGRRRGRRRRAEYRRIAAAPAPRRVPRPARRRARPSWPSATTRPTSSWPACYDPQPGDVGMHFLVAPTDTPVHGFTRAVITTVWRGSSPTRRRGGSSSSRTCATPPCTRSTPPSASSVVGRSPSPRRRRCSASAPATSSCRPADPRRASTA